MVDLRKQVVNQFAKQTIGKAIGLDSGSGPSQEESQGGPINWQHYNYPPLIRLMHYSTDQLKQPFLGLAKRMHACALLIVVN